jgi:hypothetical protein
MSNNTQQLLRSAPTSVVEPGSGPQVEITGAVIVPAPGTATERKLATTAASRPDTVETGLSGIRVRLWNLFARHPLAAVLLGYCLGRILKR